MSVSFYEYEINKIIQDLKLPKDRIHIKFIPPLKRRSGQCIFNNYTRHVDITVCMDDDYKFMIGVLMHELKHADQYISRRLVNVKGKDFVWESTVYKVIENTFHPGYSEQPWEVDANEYEKRFDLLFPQRSFIGSVPGIKAGVKLYKLG